VYRNDNQIPGVFINFEHSLEVWLSSNYCL